MWLVLAFSKVLQLMNGPLFMESLLVIVDF